MAQPKFRIVHPNAKNTGSSVEMSIRPATYLESGGLMVSFTPQRTVGGVENGKRILPTFNYDKRVTVKLTMFEVGQIISVLDGLCESIGDGKGLFHKSSKGATMIGLTHKVEPTAGYWFSVKRNPTEGEEQKIGIFLTPTEGYTLSFALKQAVFYMGFGIPENVEVAAETKEAADGKSV